MEPNEKSERPIQKIKPVTGRFIYGRPGLTKEERIWYIKEADGFSELLGDEVRPFFIDPHLPMLETETQVTFWKHISKYLSPTDVIELSNLDADFFCHSWIDNSKASKSVGVPSDIIFSKTIPLTNFEVEVKFPKATSNIHYIIFDGWKESVDVILKGEVESCCIGVIAIKAFADADMLFYAPIMIKHGFDQLASIGGGWHVFKGNSKYSFEQLKIPPVISHGMAILEETLMWAAALWYGIELTLLNPITSEIFSRPKYDDYVLPQSSSGRLHKSSGKKKSAKQGKRKVTTVHRHNITKEAFESAITKTITSEDGSTKTYTRHTMTWWVIGHWRTYKSGKKIFVSGYWKGPLREVKKNLDDGRERKIPIDT